MKGLSSFGFKLLIDQLRGEAGHDEVLTEHDVLGLLVKPTVEQWFRAC